MVIYKDGTHLVIKKEDALHYLSDAQINNLADITKTISQGRAAQGKKDNSYFICNQDEPYAQLVLATMLDGEQKKQEETYGS